MDTIGNKLTYGLFTAANKLGVQNVAGVNLGDYVYFDCGARVSDGIYIGSLSTATSEFCLERNKIDNIINLSGSDYKSSRPVFKIVMDDINVTPQTLESYIKKFASGVEAVGRARMQGKNVLIHCAAGINRSATLIGFYLIQCGWTYAEVLSALETANATRRVPILTNQSFRYLLQTRDSFRRNFGKK